MKTFSELLAICVGYPQIDRRGTLTRNFNIFFHEQTVEQIMQLPVIWDATNMLRGTPVMMCNVVTLIRLICKSLNLWDTTCEKCLSKSRIHKD